MLGFPVEKNLKELKKRMFSDSYAKKTLAGFEPIPFRKFSEYLR
jgi:hypothetical protein